MEVVIIMNKSDTTNKFGEFIKKYRTTEKKMSLREFSELIGISFSHLSKIERGEHMPSKTTVGIIADALNLDKDKLFLLAGYVSNDYSAGLDSFFPIIDEDNETKRKAAIINKIVTEFPNADLMFNDIKSWTAEDFEELYDYIKFKNSQKEK